LRPDVLSESHTFANTIDAHRYDLLRWFRTRISIGVLEAINGLVQAVKRRARGYCTDHHSIAIPSTNSYRLRTTQRAA
jgi:transposase